MREFFKGLVFITCALIIFPALPFLSEAYFTKSEAVPAITEPQESVPIYEFIETVKVYDIVKQATFTMPIEDYLAATLMSSLSHESPKEALKAQATLMYTYILTRRLSELSSPTPELMGADISTDSSKYPSLTLNTEVPQAYKTAISEVLGKYIAYNNEPIQAAFCVSSGGVTESALTVLGVDLPYLQSVKCEFDDDCITELVYTSDELFARIATGCEGVTLYGDAAAWLDITSSLPSGYVENVMLCGENHVTGSQLASVLNLPSANFTFSYSPSFDRFTFTVKGCGHLVGLSLNGACKMAYNNKTCEEILKHFFTGVEIVDSYIVS
ncbi:MAG: SpoIID/LytB domain-containing protein [Oscillospiraceae bacterium]|nr:SpoIID/LytB domain-containing protein [Oscillospiraceae bacterium]